MRAEDRGHEVAERVVAKIAGHVANFEPLPGGQRLRWWVLQGLCEAQSGGRHRAVLGIL